MKLANVLWKPVCFKKRKYYLQPIQKILVIVKRGKSNRGRWMSKRPLERFKERIPKLFSTVSSAYGKVKTFNFHKKQENKDVGNYHPITF